jgi:molybdopterin synthase sulfur carrier subunit
LKLKVLFFASLREQLGTGAMEVEVPAAVSSVGALRAHLRGLGSAYDAALGEKRALRMAVNQDMVPASAPVKAGDEVAFFPPVTGG